MRIIDADEIPFVSDPKHPHVQGFQTVTKMAIDNTPTVEAIPIEYIKSESQRVNEMIQSAAEEGNIKEADRLSTVMATLDAVVSNWIYTTGEEWRKKNE